MRDARGEEAKSRSVNHEPRVKERAGRSEQSRGVRKKAAGEGKRRKDTPATSSSTRFWTSPNTVATSVPTRKSPRPARPAFHTKDTYESRRSGEGAVVGGAGTRRGGGG